MARHAARFARCRDRGRPPRGEAALGESRRAPRRRHGPRLARLRRTCHHLGDAHHAHRGPARGLDRMDLGDRSDPSRDRDLSTPPVVDGVNARDGDWRRAQAVIAIGLAIRLGLAASLPLFPDETYYWLFSRHLDGGYFDHPYGIAALI